MRLFELDEPAKDPVIVRVSDQRVVEDVVLEIMFLDLLTKLDDLFFCGDAGFSRRNLGGIPSRNRDLFASEKR
jgi:hypothetical protein